MRYRVEAQACKCSPPDFGAELINLFNRIICASDASSPLIKSLATLQENGTMTTTTRRVLAASAVAAPSTSSIESGGRVRGYPQGTSSDGQSRRQYLRELYSELV